MVMNYYILQHFVCNVCGKHKHGISKNLTIPRHHKEINIGCQYCKTNIRVSLYSHFYGCWMHSAECDSSSSPIHFRIVNVT